MGGTQGGGGSFDMTNGGLLKKARILDFGGSTFHYLFLKIILYISFFISSKFTNLQSGLIKKKSIERFKVTADIISILIHNNTLQSFVRSSITLNIHVSRFEN